MEVLLVTIKVKPEAIEAFRAASLENAFASRKEAGVAGFDLLQDEADPGAFVLVEVYRDAEGMARHKETPHYLKWKELAEPLMAAPRTRAIYRLLSQD